MNSKFVKLKKDIDSLSLDYRSMKLVADSLTTENIRTTETLRRALLEPKAAVDKVNDQWRTGVSVSVWFSVIFYVVFSY
jgi:hypothetical protein